MIETGLMTRCRRLYFLFGSLLLIFFFYAPSFPQAAPFKLRVTEELANIRQSPDIRSPVLLQVIQNTILEGLKKEGEWYLVSFRDEDGSARTGYIHESLVAVMEAESQPAEKPATSVPPPEKKVSPPPVETKAPQKPTAKPAPAPKLPPISPQTKKGFGLSLAPGLEWLSLSQVNESATGLAGLMSDLLRAEPSRQVSSLHLAASANLELRLPLRANFSLLLNCGGLTAGQKNSVAFSHLPSGSNLIIESKLRAVPVSLLLSTEINRFLALAIGPEVTAAEYRYFYQLTNEKQTEDWSGQARALGLGLRGQFVFSLPLSSRWSILAEAGGRLEEISGWQGKDTHRLPSGERAEEEGRLYSFQVKTSGEKSYPLIFIRSRRPEEAGVEKAREASLNLNGFCLRFGLIFYF